MISLDLFSLIATAKVLVLVFIWTFCHGRHFSQRGWPGLPRSNIHLLRLFKGLSFEVLGLRLAVGGFVASFLDDDYGSHRRLLALLRDQLERQWL